MSKFVREIHGRVAMAEISAYDGIIAEIIADHERGKYLRKKHHDGCKMQKARPGKSRKYLDNYDSTRDKFNCGNSGWRNISRAEILAEDWQREEISIAEDAEKLMSEFLKIHEWLKYA